MLKNIAFASAGVLLLASPLLASAQSTDVVSQCSSITHSMGLDDTDATTGGDVTRLQQFLVAGGFLTMPTGVAFGTFGNLTEAAVQAFQIQHSIVSSGTPDTTGYGRVGPLTITAINQSCSGSQGGDTSTTEQSTITIPAQDENAFLFFKAPGNNWKGITSIEYKLCEGFDLAWGDGKTSSASGVGSNCSIIKKTTLEHTYPAGVATYYPALTKGLVAPASRVMSAGSAPLAAWCSLETTGDVDNDGAFDMRWNTNNAIDVRIEGVPLTGESGTVTLYNTGLSNRQIGLSVVGVDGAGKTCGFGPFNEAQKLPAGVSATTHTSPVKRTSSTYTTPFFETAEAFRGQIGTQYTMDCVAGRVSTFRVRGTDVYTDNSLVCGAAVHAGLIQMGTGGSVTIRIVASPSTFTGSTRNGVTSTGIQGWYGNAFEFVTSQPSTLFALGDRVQTTVNANVRSAASLSGSLAGTQVSGSFGTITGGPNTASGYAWWQINFDLGTDGWTVQDNLQTATSAQQCPAGTTGTYPNCTNTALTSLSAHDKVQMLYVGYLGRAADTSGMTYWQNALTSGAMTLAQIAQNFGLSAEAKTLYPYLASPSTADKNTFLTKVYQTLFSRAPEFAESAESAHWTDELNARTGNAGTIAQIVLDIEHGAQGSDVTTLLGKITAANAITPGVLNGTCGSVNGTTVASAPTSNLCTAGTASTVTGSGPWTWSCAGTGGGTTASCSASKTGGDTSTTPTQPTMSTAVCNADGTSATLSWGAVSVSGVASSNIKYPVRYSGSGLTCPTTSGWWSARAGECDFDTNTATSVTVPVTPGVTYQWWVHTANATNANQWAWSPSTQVSFTCSASATSQSCTAPWGTTIANGSGVTAYSTSFVAVGSTCVSQQRTCTNGSLSGGYYYQNCSPGTVSASVGTNYGAVTFSSPPSGATYVKGSDTIPVRFSQGFGAVQFENVATGVISSGAGLFSGTDNQMNIPFDLAPGNYRLAMHNERYDGTSSAFTVAATGNSPLWVKPGSELNACRFFAGVDKYDVVTTRDARCTGARCVSPKFIIMWSASSGMYEDRPDYLPADGTLKQIRCSATGAEPAATAAAASCPFAGGTLAHGASVDAYQAASVPLGSSCVTERRTCLNGSLSGSYQFSSCEPAWSAGQSIWVKPGHEAAVCTIAAGASAYTNVTTRNASCTGARCVSPKFFWAIGGTLIAEDRPDYLPADGIVKQIQCTATTAAAGTNTQMLSQLANALNAIIAILNSLK